MKKLMIMSVLVLSSFIYKAADAQVTISINIGSQPEWGPAGYNRAEYYYLPDIDVYYHIANHSYTWYEGNRWITRTTLPARYRNYDLYKGYKVVINERNPWNKHQEIRARYAQFRGRSNQQNLRDSRYAQYTPRKETPSFKQDNSRPANSRAGSDSRTPQAGKQDSRNDVRRESPRDQRRS